MPTPPWVQPVTLSLNGIHLEPLTLQHAEGLAQAAADGKLWELRVTSVPTPEDTVAYIETALAMQAAGTRLPFAVVDEANGTVLGCTSYHDIVNPIRRLEVGYTWYAHSVQRSHVNTSCKLMLLTHAFETLQAQVVGWRTDILNTNSQRAIERLGARKDGVLRHHMLRRDGSVRDTVMYSMLAQEWPAAKQYLLQRLAAYSR